MLENWSCALSATDGALLGVRCTPLSPSLVSSSFPGIDVLPRQRDGNFLDHATQRAEINNTAREEIRPKLEYRPDYVSRYLSSEPIQARATDSSLNTVDRFRSSVGDGLL